MLPLEEFVLRFHKPLILNTLKTTELNLKLFYRNNEILERQHNPSKKEEPIRKDITKKEVDYYLEKCYTIPNDYLIPEERIDYTKNKHNKLLTCSHEGILWSDSLAKTRF